MNHHLAILVQVFRFGQWRKVTTISFDANRAKSYRSGGDVVLNRKDALREALRCLTSWRESDQFIGLELRMVYQTYSGIEPIQH